MDKSNYQSTDTLTEGSLLARNTVFNILSEITPIIIAILVIPQLIEKLGTDRFGVLTLVWVAIGYFSFFDLGLGRALTKSVAEKLGKQEEESLPDLIYTSLFFMSLLGLAGMIAILTFSPWLIHNLLKIPNTLQTETLQAFYALSLSIPIVICSAGLRGVLEGLQRFKIVAKIRIPFSLATFLGPLFMAYFTNNLFLIVCILVIIRLFVFFVYLFSCLNILTVTRKRHALRPKEMRYLLRIGSWMTVSNIISPLMSILDRFLIGGLISIAGVAYYATPAEMINKLIIIPGAFIAVLFPAFSTSFSRDPKRVSQLFDKGSKIIFLFVYPFVLIIVTLAPELLTLWLGKIFMQQSTSVLQWLTIGMLFNCLALVPFILLQGSGRPDITAKLHIIEFPLYLMLVWSLVKTRGVEGAAIAYFIRVTIDMLLLYVITRQHLNIKVSERLQKHLFFGLIILVIPMALFTTETILKSLFLLLVVTAFISNSWYKLLEQEERQWVKRYIGKKAIRPIG